MVVKRLMCLFERQIRDIGKWLGAGRSWWQKGRMGTRGGKMGAQGRILRHSGARQGVQCLGAL